MVWFERSTGGKKEPEKGDRRPDVVQSAPVSAPSPTVPEPKVEAKPAPVEQALVGCLYRGSRVSGQLTFQGPARIDGSVDGEIQCHGTLTIGEGAEVRAKIFSQVLIVRGRVEGNVVAKERIELTAPARLFGNIDTPRLIITGGVVFDGDCSMGAAKQKSGVANGQTVSTDKAAVAEAPRLQADSEK